MAIGRSKHTHKAHESGAQVFRQVDALRWQQGKPQLNLAAAWWGSPIWVGLVLLVFAMLLVAVLAWHYSPEVVWAGLRKARWHQAQQVLGSEMSFTVLCLVAGWLFVRINGRFELVVSSTELRLRHPWQWVERHFGWRTPLATLADQVTWGLVGHPRSA